MTDTDSSPIPAVLPVAGTEPPEPSGPQARPPRRAHRGGGKGAQRGPGERGGPAQAPPRAQAPRPQRTVHPVLERLFALYPKLFGGHFLPLKLGVFQDLLAAHPDVFGRDELKVALGLHARSTRYLESVAAGHQRHDLQGRPVEDVAPEHVHHAIMEVWKRRQSRAGEDRHAQLHSRLVAAIEASGLAPDAYAERVRTQDPEAVASLDAALAEVRAQAARREALLRAFDTAGGADVARFAEMYGMDADDVGRTLERARRDRERTEAAGASLLSI